MDLFIHQYFCVVFIKIWIYVYFKGVVGMMLVMQVKYITTFPQTTREWKSIYIQNHNLPVASLDTTAPQNITIKIWARTYCTNHRPHNTQGYAYDTIQSAVLSFQKHLPKSYLINTSSLQSHTNRPLFPCRPLGNICSTGNLTTLFPSSSHFLRLPCVLKNL